MRLHTGASGDFEVRDKGEKGTEARASLKMTNVYGVGGTDSIWHVCG